MANRLPSGSTLSRWHATRIPTSNPLRVVVAGAGVGGLETMVALRSLVGHRVALTLVAPQDDFTVHALEVFEPFGLGSAQRYPVAALAADLDAIFLHDAVARVERDERTVHLQSGDELVYDRARARGRGVPVPGLRARRLLHSARTTRRRSTASSPTSAAARPSASRSSFRRGARGRCRPTSWR